MQRESFIFYRSFYEAIREMPRDIQGEIYTAIMEYSLFGNETENLKPIAKAVFILIKPQLDANLTRYENGKKGGNPNFKKGNANPYYKKNENQANAEFPITDITETLPRDNQEITKTLPNVNVNVNDNVNAIKEKNIKKENPLLKNIPEDKKQIAEDYIFYRKEIKKPIKTSLALQKHLTSLELCVSQGLGTYQSLTQKMKEKEWLTIEPGYLQHHNKSYPSYKKQDMSDYLQSKGIPVGSTETIETEIIKWTQSKK